MALANSEAIDVRLSPNQVGRLEPMEGEGREAVRKTAIPNRVEHP